MQKVVLPKIRKFELDIDSEWKKWGNIEFAVKIKQYRNDFDRSPCGSFSNDVTFAPREPGGGKRHEFFDSLSPHETGFAGPRFFVDTKRSDLVLGQTRT